MNLRELTQDQQEILAQVENDEFSIDDVSDHLNMLESERNKKIESYLHVINRLTSEEVTIKTELERLQAIRLTKEKALTRIKEWLLMSMRDGEKHQFDLFKVSKVKGREVIKITNDSLISESYTEYKEIRTVDKRAMLSDLKAGKEVPGAEISIGNPSLRIK
tara:strand:+ start:54 stop:539 length:486 start_codon:yes stop_codon:yes gene_type:complete